MKNIENLKPFTSEQSHEEAVKNGRKGGIASAKARAERKAMKDLFLMLGNLPLKASEAENIEEIRSIAELKGKNITPEEAMALMVVTKAAKGDLRYIEFYRDTIGEKPTDKEEADIDMDLHITIDYGS